MRNHTAGLAGDYQYIQQSKGESRITPILARITRNAPETPVRALWKQALPPDIRLLTVKSVPESV